MFRIIAAVLVPFSCLVSYAAPPTFHKDVEPILQNRCQGCHRPGEAAPMPSARITTKPGPGPKRFAARCSPARCLPGRPIRITGNSPTIFRLRRAKRKRSSPGWTAARAKEIPRMRPKPRRVHGRMAHSEAGRGFRDAGAIFTSPPPACINYQYIPVPTHFTEDKWVQMVEVRPGDRSVVHHAIVVTDDGTGSRERGISGRLRARHDAADLEAGASAAD